MVLILWLVVVELLVIGKDEQVGTYLLNDNRLNVNTTNNKSKVTRYISSDDKLTFCNANMT